MKLNNFKKINFNGTEIDKVKYNGNYIWEKNNNFILFKSEDNLDFTLRTNNTSKNWNGIIEYSTNAKTWDTWDGSLINSNNGKLYLRGTNNTTIINTTNYSTAQNRCFVLEGDSNQIQCNGNIENLLDYIKIINGEHPTMASYCFYCLFYNCSKLVKAPELLATTLTSYCYDHMFYNCSSLITIPQLLAITLKDSCYSRMFYNCTSLKVSTTQTAEYKYAWRIPTSGIGTIASSWNESMLMTTGGTFTSNPSINTTYYVQNRPVGPISLNPPVISLNENILTITDSSINEKYTKGFNIYNGNKLIATQLKDVTTLDLSTILTQTGTYNICISCYGDEGILESGFSNKITYKTGDFTPVESGNYITFEAEDNNEFTLGIDHDWNGTLEYSTNAQTWSTWSWNTSTINSNNCKIYLRGSNNKRISAYFNYSTFISTHFTLKGDSDRVQCNGNIENLLDYKTVASGEHPIMDIYCLYSLFKDCTSLTTAPELPATTLMNYCYSYMFAGCTSLIATPELPATELTNYCYNNMFLGCTSLTTTPELPATTLADYCYNSMFKDCTSLTIPPELPATILADYCYSGMFSGCTSLISMPQLLATVLEEGCYNSMFYNCTSLTTIYALSALTLARYCYNYMFYGCTSLTTILELSATELLNGCYSRMFYNCTSLKVSSTQTDEYQYEWRIPTSDTGSSESSWNSTPWNKDMLKNTNGTFSSDPSMNTIYYVQNKPIKPILLVSPSLSLSGNILTIADSPANEGYTDGFEIYNGNKLIATQQKDITTLDLSTILTKNGIYSIYVNCYSNNDIANIKSDEIVYTVGEFAPAKSGNYIVFEAEDNNEFTLNVYSMKKNWYGTLEYSTDTTSWNTWDGSLINSNSGKLYLRGIKNTYIVGKDPDVRRTEAIESRFELKGDSTRIQCNGNIENLLNYQTVANGKHPSMDPYTYIYLFSECKTLVVPPELPATSLADYCYYCMFKNCTSLRAVPLLPATTIRDYCYAYMLSDCKSLKFSETQTEEYSYEFRVPSNGSIDRTINQWITNMIENTGGTFTGYLSANKTYYTQNKSTPIKLNSPTISLNENILTITDSIVNEEYTKGFNIYNGNKLISTQLKNVTTFDLSTVLADGIYNITVRTYGDGKIIESLPSNKLVCTVGEFTPIESGNYITFEAEDNNEFTLGVYNQSANWDGTIEYSTDNIIWTTWNGTLINSDNSKLYLRGINNTKIIKSTSSYTITDCFVLAGDSERIQCNGNIENLLDYQTVANGEHPTMANYCFYYLFYKCSKLVKAPELPATILAEYCYADMFYSCTSLTASPELPATTLANRCYDSMFQDCTSLIATPELPATTLAENCYNGMFESCTSLIIPAHLPATTLATSCYANMFSNCTSLTTVSLLPATILTSSCYAAMFRYCSSLEFSNTATTKCPYAWRMPTTGTGTTASSWNWNMLDKTQGVFYYYGPSINTTYYTTNEPV